MSDDPRVRELTDAELKLVRRVAEIELGAPELSDEQRQIKAWFDRFDAMISVGGRPN